MANLTLGRGELFFARYLNGTTNPGGERYIGNTPEFNATIEVETLDHFSSDHGVNEKDESVPTQTNRTATFITDNIDPANIALFFFGSETALTVTSSTVAAEPIPAVIKGLQYQLGTSPSHPAGVRKLSDVTVKDDAGVPNTFVEGVDYKLYADLGRIEILAGGGITSGTNLVVGYTVGAHTRERIISGTQPISGAMRFIADNPVGENFDWFLPYVKLSPNGDYALKGEEWQQIPFNVEILKKTGLEAIYIDGRPYTPTP